MLWIELRRRALALCPISAGASNISFRCLLDQATNTTCDSRTETASWGQKKAVGLRSRYATVFNAAHSYEAAQRS